MWNDPEVFGGFLLVRRLADSAMASVSLAVRLGDPSGKPLVVKRPPLGERASGRAAQAILREAEVLSAVRGGGIPLLEGAGDIAGLPYVAVERLRGATLAKVVALAGPLPMAAVRAVGRDVARALARLHEAGWVHRDVTPSNLFIDDAGEAYLLDFGLCERAGDERGAPVAGTRGYAAPEAPTTAAARPPQDVYGLGVCLAEAALGKRLFDEASLVEAAARGDAPKKVASLEADLPGIEAALRRDPSARPSAAELVESLGSVTSAPGDPSGSSLLAELAERARTSENEPGAQAIGAAPEGALAVAMPPPARAVTPVHEASNEAVSKAIERSHPLAARAPQTVFGPPPSPLTPTVAMPAVTVREIPQRESGVVDTVRDLTAEPAPAAPQRATSSRRAWWIAAIGACAALVIGFVSGRFSHRSATLAIVGPLPKRAEVLLDAKRLTVADGAPLRISAGDHTLTITGPKASKRDISFTAQPGDRVVIVSPLKSGAQTDEPGDNFGPEKPLSNPPKPVPSAPAGSRKVPVTEVIEATSGPTIRRIRKLRVEVVDARGSKDKGAVYTFAQDEVRVGMSEDADVPLADPATSREHLAVRLSSNGYTLADLGSTNGTFIGDLRIERVVITEPTLVRVGQTLLRLVPLAESVEQEISPHARFGRMLGQSPAMRETFALLERVAATDLTVLLEGETGTGKELAAEGLHDSSARAGQFVAVNCGAIPRELLESELLGHEKGAFTGADRPRPGAFLTADRGTLFLDEVGELPLDMQAKLLRVLERREVKPVGADRAKTVDVRVVAATNRSLAREVSAGRFRQDLYFRLAVVVVRIPPLRTRAGDVRMLAEHIQDELARKRVAAGLTPLGRLDERAMAMLLRYDFPGNVRELRNVVERWAVLGAVGAPGDPAGWSGTAPAVSQGNPSSAAPGDVDSALLTLPFHEAKDAWVDRFERAYLAALLVRCENNVSRAAREAGVDRRHVQRMMGRFGMKGGDNNP